MEKELARERQRIYHQQWREKMKAENPNEWKEYKRSHTRNYRLKYPEKRSAEQKINNMIRRGDIVKGNCLVCGNKDTEGHHPDYNKPDFVFWLCNRHHTAIHNRKKELGG